LSARLTFCRTMWSTATSGSPIFRRLLGGEHALEGHWTDAPAVPVRRVNFGAGWRAFGWIVADDDLTTHVLPTASGTVSQVYACVGQVVAKDLALLLAYNLEAEGYVVESAERGDEAELRLAENVPDLVILDWDLCHGRFAADPH
jgi:hypothetical protein